MYFVVFNFLFYSYYSYNQIEGRATLKRAYEFNVAFLKTPGHYTLFSQQSLKVGQHQLLDFSSGCGTGQPTMPGEQF